MVGEQLVDGAGHAGPDRRRARRGGRTPARRRASEVRREDDGRPVLGDELHEVGEELAPGERIEARHRLVEHEELGALAHRERQRQLRALAAGEAAGPLAEVEPEAGRSAGPRARASHVGFRLAPSRRWSADGERRGRAARPGRRTRSARAGRRSAPGRSPEHVDRPLGRVEQPDREVQQRRLARAVRADEPDDAAGRDRERAVAQRPAAAVALARARRPRAPARHATPSSPSARKRALEERGDAVVVEPGAARLRRASRPARAAAPCGAASDESASDRGHEGAEPGPTRRPGPRARARGTP